MGTLHDIFTGKIIESTRAVDVVDAAWRMRDHIRSDIRTGKLPHGLVVRVRSQRGCPRDTIVVTATLPSSANGNENLSQLAHDLSTICDFYNDETLNTSRQFRVRVDCTVSLDGTVFAKKKA